MREEAVCSGIYVSLTSHPPLSLSPHRYRWTTKAGMEKRRHLPRRQATVSISTSLHVSSPLPSPSPLLPAIVGSVPQVV